jgi:rare lipoprotein A (peptidoglycan hydrolase)
LRLTARSALAIALAACILALTAITAAGQPSSAQTAEDRARVERAVGELEEARDEAARVNAQVAEASAELDRIIAEQQLARARLTTRAQVMYRSGQTSVVTVLLGAEDFQDFATRWDLLMRLNQQDAADVKTLEIARIQTEQSAESLMALQAEQAAAVDAVESKVANAREELASSEAALAAYEARIAEKPKAQSASQPSASAQAPSDSNQSLTGSGAWKTGVASHYGRSFTGRGASGKPIGPYSMMLAHKTLPFGTLIEFSYHGKTAVASVEDRGPHVAGRDFDLGPGVVRVLGFSGVDEVKYRIIR